MAINGIGVARISAPLLHPLGEHELHALDKREDQRRAERTAEPGPRAREQFGDAARGGYGESDGDERQRRPQGYHLVRPFLQRHAEAPRK